jgi:beta-1,4-mannosyl-glycoprotein beta-1,4-N-acetylglucosaminyltransferase
VDARSHALVGGMMRPRVVDTFMVNDELDMLECRLVEIADAVDYVVAVEADVDHQDHPKPFHLTENLSRFEQWAGKLIVVRATGLPTAADDPDPWAREHAQREYVGPALHKLGAEPDWVVLHGDVDEIPTAVAARNVRPNGLLSFEQRGHFWSLNWQYPHPWYGTVAGRVGAIRSFGAMRDARNIAPKLPNAGWHLSWLGGAERALKKVGSFCHPEVEERIVSGLETDRFLQAGIHVDGVKMVRCEVDRTFPKWIRQGKAPKSWSL